MGDLIQQTMLLTLKDWSEVHEKFEEERKVVLNKVYRNTRQILKYIQDTGFKTEIPINIKNGELVIEKIFLINQRKCPSWKRLLKKNLHKTVGILAKTEEYLEEYKNNFLQVTNYLS